MAAANSEENQALNELAKRFQDEIVRLVDQSKQGVETFSPRETYSDEEDLFNIAEAPETSQSSETQQISVPVDVLEESLNAQRCDTNYGDIVHLAAQLAGSCADQQEACFPAHIYCRKRSKDNDAIARPVHCDANAFNLSESSDSCCKANLCVGLTDEERREIMQAVDSF